MTNDDGVEVEAFTDEDLDGEMFEEVAGPGRHPYGDMQETYDKARRRAMGSEKAIDEILLDLEGD